MIYPETGLVAVWVGDIASSELLDAYVAGDFGKDFEIPNGQGGTPEADCGDERPIRELLNGFSQWKRFVDAAVVAGSALRKERARCAVVFYAARYDGTPGAQARLTFLGNFRLLPKITRATPIQ
jgi:hypothetical protein